jgi:hypothetical protein
MPGWQGRVTRSRYGAGKDSANVRDDGGVRSTFGEQPLCSRYFPGMTGSSGYAVLTLRLSKRDPTGTYRVAATASVPAALSAIGSTTFKVR